NSEVGHMNLGAGRIVYQDLVKINLAVKNNTLIQEPALIAAFNHAKTNKKPIHFLGLVSDGGVHSHINHLKGLITAAETSGVTESYIHAFTDGRDVDPKSGYGFITHLEEFIQNSATKLATISDRYYAMDRDKRWERGKLADNALVKGTREFAKSAINSSEKSYDNDITDDFINPTIMVDENIQPMAIVKNGDGVRFFNS